MTTSTFSPEISQDTVNRNKPFITTFGEKGQGQSQFTSPYGIACDIKNNHRILVADCATNRIKVFSRDGRYLSEFGNSSEFGNIGTHLNQQTQLEQPCQLSIQPITDHIVVADCNRDNIYIFDSQGKLKLFFGSEVLRYPWAVDCSHCPFQQRIVAADLMHNVHLFELSQDNNKFTVRTFCSTGSNPNQTQSVHGICFDDERKRILIADFHNHRISVWSNDGSQFLHTIPMPYKNQNPLSVCVDHYAYYPHHIVVGTRQSQIHIYDARMEQQQEEGGVLQTIGSEGKQPGQFGGSIYGVCIDDDGALLTTDFGNHRVQIFANHRSSSMISLLSSASHHPHRPPTIPQQQQPSSFNSNKRQKTTITNQQQEEKEAAVTTVIPSVYASFVNDGLFDMHLVREIGAFVPPYTNAS